MHCLNIKEETINFVGVAVGELALKNGCRGEKPPEQDSQE